MKIPDKSSSDPLRDKQATADLTVNLNIHNFHAWQSVQRQRFHYIRFDANNDCNVHCVYCHIPRSKDLIDHDQFRTFLEEKVEGTNLFQFGCQMEPTLDNRLVSFMQAVATSPAKPRQIFRLQTNGILLHRHDHEKMCDAGLNFLGVSMDSVDPDLVRKLRGGTSLSKVYRNVTEFHRNCPRVKVAFITTVTSANIGVIEDLVKAGLNSGVSVFNLRQVSYHPDNPIVDHSLMRELVVSNNAFDEMAERVKSKYSKLAQFSIQGAQVLTESAVTVRAASGLPQTETELIRLISMGLSR